MDIALIQDLHVLPHGLAHIDYVPQKIQLRLRFYLNLSYFIQLGTIQVLLQQRGGWVGSEFFC